MDSTSDLAVLDAESDASSDVALADGDSACTCTMVDSGLPAPLPGNGVLSMPCYCVRPWAGGFSTAPGCSSYEAATRCDATLLSFSVETYTNCNLVTVRHGGGLIEAALVYDRTSKDLVGAYRWTDHGVPCGTNQAFMIMTGIVPGPECQSAAIEFPCVDAGGADRDGALPDAMPPSGDASALWRSDARR